MSGEAGSGEEVLMEMKKGYCPKCGNVVVLAEYGRYLSKECKGFRYTYEGWCSKCAEHMVERNTSEKLNAVK